MRGRRIKRNERTLSNPTALDLLVDSLRPPPPPIKRKRGRPPGSRSKSTLVNDYVYKLAEEYRLLYLTRAERRMRAKYAELLVGHTTISPILDLRGEEAVFPPGVLLTLELLNSLPVEVIQHIVVGEPMDTKVEETMARYWRTRTKLVKQGLRGGGAK
jgi:hypothetical protein